MSALASAADLVNRLGRDLTDTETARAGSLLADASALIRAFTGQTFESAAETVVLRAQGDQIRLPHTPVTAVASVVAVGEAGIPDLPVADWVWDGLDLIRLGSGRLVINLPETWADDESGYAGTFRVTYTAGPAQVPADVVAVVCRMVLRTLTDPGTAGNMIAETDGNYSYKLDAAGGGLAVALTAADKADLVRYRRTSGMTMLRVR